VFQPIFNNSFNVSAVSIRPSYLTKPTNVTFYYILRGKNNSISLGVYGGLKDYLSSKSRTYWCPPDCLTENQMELVPLDEEISKPLLDEILVNLTARNANTDDKARVAISFVQQIPYDWSKFTTNDLNNRYPYEVIYDYTGVCGEKAKLLAYFLKKLGYGVALFKYPYHEAVGVRCPIEYSLGQSGYCFIETSSATIITDADSEYYLTSTTLSKLPSNPEIIVVSEGSTFSSVSEEYKDAQRLKSIEQMGTTVPYETYSDWNALIKKYGISTS
jgi:hypothetical protein